MSDAELDRLQEQFKRIRKAQAKDERATGELVTEEES
jgi:hypothetical protein